METNDNIIICILCDEPITDMNVAVQDKHGNYAHSFCANIDYY